MANLTFEYCSSYKNLPPLVAVIFGVVERNSPNLVHECPYAPVKYIGVDNYTLNPQTPLLTIANFQRGDYKQTLYIRDKHNRMIFYLHTYYAVSLKKGQKG